MIGSLCSPVYAFEKSHTQEFVVTAYYSPLPDQCCYFRGSYEEEIIFNGNGIKGADSTPVYPGMLAAPSTYAFGTIVDLPGIGVGTVHDRGGRITEWGDDLHRIDVWMGTGEEGLARAMTWGVQRVSGTVYPVGSENAPREQVSFDRFKADSAILAGLPKTDTTLVLSQAAFGGQEYSSRLLQSTLKDLGYFDHPVTGEFGTVTQEAMKAFLDDQSLPGDGSKVGELTAAALTAAASIKAANLPDLAIGLQKGSRGDNVRQLQKLLRYLGFYHGRTDGNFDTHLKESVTGFQMSRNIIAHMLDQGAGRVGPVTKTAILKAWKGRIVAGKASGIVARMHLALRVKKEELPSKMLATGDRGVDVKRLQAFLKENGYLDAKSVTGTFGSRTASALIKYQIDRKIVESAGSHGAGVFGPTTRMVVAIEAVDAKWRQVRAEGMGAL